MNTFSRNTPLAYVMGAAGFIGSYVTEKLLEKNIQVVGVDNLHSGRKENLAEAVKNKNFHFFNQNGGNETTTDLPRLDYAFFIITEDLPRHIFRNALEKFLEGCKKFNPKIVLVSSVDLYDNNIEGLDNLRQAEKTLANSSVGSKINARVIRLSTVYGPRMHFRGTDPILRLIEAAILDKLQKETTPLDFSTRALFIEDAVELLIKAVMHGATAQKIFDGTLQHPLEISEVRQVLLDPVWYENKGFDPTQLPPWITPNLARTQKELSWQPKTQLVKALRQTIHFFKERPEYMPEKEKEVPRAQTENRLGWVKEEAKKEEPQKKELSPVTKKRNGSFKQFKNYLGILIGVLIISYTFLYPIVEVFIGSYVVSRSLEKTNQALMEGDIDKADKENLQGKKGIELLSDANQHAKILQLNQLEQLVLGYSKAIDASLQITSGQKSLVEGIKVVSGEKEGDGKALFETANTQFAQADKDLNLSNLVFRENSPKKFFLPTINTKEGEQIIKLGQPIATILTSLVRADGEKDLLVLLLDSANLRSSGGKVLSYAQVKFNKGKLVNIKAGDINALDQSFTDHIEPPLEVKSDLGISEWRLGEFNNDPDFVISAKRALWFYAKEAGVQASGVISLDNKTLLSLLGKSELPKEGKEIASLLKEGLNRIFFSSNQNLPQVAQSLARAVTEKNMMIYLSDPGAMSYLNAQGFSGGSLKVSKEGKEDFLAFYETDLSENGAKVQRQIELQASLDERKNLSHKLTINYINQGDLFKKRLKIFLPSGSRLISATWGESDIIRNVSSFTDYGRSGYSMLLNLSGGQTKVLSLEYQNQRVLEEKEGKIDYKLVMVKQPGLGSDKFNFKLNLPSSWKVLGGTNEFSASTDLSQDRQFEVVVAH